MTAHAEWVERMRSMAVLDVAKRLGLSTREPRNSSDGEVYDCPACGACTRHRKSRDRRGAIGIKGRGWKCFQCDAGGGTIDLVAYVLHGRAYRELDDDGKRGVRARCIELTGASDSSTSARSTSRARPTHAPQRPVEAVESAPPTYVDAEEARAFWEGCRPVTEAPHTAEAMRARRIDPVAVADLDIARALPKRGVELPSWAMFGRRSWRELGYHWITVMFDACGVMRSCVARNVLDDEERTRLAGFEIPKSVAPRGYSRAGLVLACPLARQILESGARPDWWPGDVEFRVELCEGEKKLLQRALSRSDASELAPAVIGVESGAWTPAIAARIPDATTLYIATDQNDAGARYATKIVQSLAPRIASGAIRVELRHEFKLTRDRNALRVEVT